MNNNPQVQTIDKRAAMKITETRTDGSLTAQKPPQEQGASELAKKSNLIAAK